MKFKAKAPTQSIAEENAIRPLNRTTSVFPASLIGRHRKRDETRSEMRQKNATMLDTRRQLKQLKKITCDVIIMTSDEAGKQRMKQRMKQNENLYYSKINCSLDGRESSEAGRTNN